MGWPKGKKRKEQKIIRDKYCQKCQKLIVRRERDGYRETDMEYAMRVYCSKACHMEAMKYHRIIRKK